MVERNLAKVEVAGSTPVIRSKGLPWGFSPIAPCQKFGKWRHSQAVRQRSATPLSPVRFWVAPPKFTPPKKQDADVAQVVAHILGKDEVAGPNPAISSSFGSVVQLVRTPPCHGGGQGFESPSNRHSSRKRTVNADLAHLVERNLAKVEVAGSTPVIRSMKALRKKCFLFIPTEALPQKNSAKAVESVAFAESLFYCLNRSPPSASRRRRSLPGSDRRY